MDNLDKKKIIFLIQGTGRGHISQALAIKEILDSIGYKLEACILGTTKGKIIPQYFYDNIGSKVYEMESPQFYTSNNKSLNITKTIVKNLKKVKEFKKSVSKIDTIINEIKPDLIINFYEFLSGLWKLSHKNKYLMISIGHQYLFDKKDFEFPDKNYLQQFLLKLNNNITSIGSKEKWALSFYGNKDTKKIKIIPPIIRNEVTIKKTIDGDFYMAYLCNEGYLEEIKNIANKYKNEKFEVFINVNNKQIINNLTINPLSDSIFLDKLSKCKGLITTSGFETVCEAAILNKPCLLVPMENHYEQKCNAFDAQKINGGLFSNFYDFDNFRDYVNIHTENESFKYWSSFNKKMLIYRIKSVIYNNEN